MSTVFVAVEVVMKPPIIYGVPFSQPVRAVLWLLLANGSRSNSEW